MIPGKSLLAAFLLASITVASGKPPRVFILDGKALLENRRNVRAGDEKLRAALARLVKDADTRLSAGP